MAGATPPGSRPRPRRRSTSLNVALKARRDAGAGPTDPGYIGNIGDLATVLTETGKPAEALGPARSGHQGPDREVRARLRDADRSPAQSLYHHRQGRRRRSPRSRPSSRPAEPPDGPSSISSSAGCSRKSSKISGQEKHQGPGELDPVVQDGLEHARRQQDRPDVRIARLGRLRACSHLDAYARTPKKCSAGC